MVRGSPARSTLVAGLASVVLAACTAGSESQGAARGASQEPASASSSGEPGPAAASSGEPGSAAASGEAEPSADAPDQPLVIAVHTTSRLRDVSLARARRIIAGRTRLVVAEGPPRAALRAVVRQRGTVAVVPAGTLGPQVRALRVGGVDPVRQPGRYPLRTPAREEPGPVVTVSVVGDIMLGRGVAEAAQGSGDPALALRPTAGRLSGADITVGNLENTLSRAGRPTQGGDSFAADPAVVEGLSEAGFDVLGLANNHLGDFGDRALVQTVRRLRDGGIGTFGAGAGVREAWRPAVVERAGGDVEVGVGDPA